MTFEHLHEIVQNSSKYDHIEENFKSKLAAGALGLAAGFGMNKGTDDSYNIHKDPILQYSSEFTNNEDQMNIKGLKEIISNRGQQLVENEQQKVLNNFLTIYKSNYAEFARSHPETFESILKTSFEISVDYIEGRLPRREYDKKIQYIKAAIDNYRSQSEMEYHK